MTHVLVQCVEHQDSYMILYLSLGQRRPHLWDFGTVWHIAQHLLTDGFENIQVVVLQHTNDAVATVVPRIADGAPAFDVWPGGTSDVGGSRARRSSWTSRGRMWGRRACVGQEA